MNSVQSQDNATVNSLLRSDTEIFFISALILFLELALIRWIGTEIRIFAYLGNLTLVMCFFGVGWGCYRAGKRVDPLVMAVSLLCLATLVANPFHIKALSVANVTFQLSGFEDSTVWRDIHAPAGYITGIFVIGLLIGLLTLTFMPLGQILGRVMQRAPRIIRAYSVNIAGSLVGVWVFNSLSWTCTPPTIWMLVVAGLLAAVLIAGRARAWLAVGLVMMAAGAVWLGDQSSDTIIWSPYQKMVVTPFWTTGYNPVQWGYILRVNGTVHQTILDLSDNFVTNHPGLFADDPFERNVYSVPFSFKPHPNRVLIVGAGTGNNAAAALRHDAGQVDCVEIDPQIYALGQQIHPEHPYSSPRVRMVVDDARAFFKQATGKYDLIWYGWLDAHTLGSSYNNMRLDHYVYTLQSFSEARKLLAPDGVMLVNFPVQRDWMVDRMFNLLRQTFGHDPYVFCDLAIAARLKRVPTVTLVIGERPVTLQTIESPTLRDYIASVRMYPSGTTRATTDDWPYLYLRQARIPKLHVIVSTAILVVVLLAGRRAFGVASGSDWHFFALGAAFLLLEVQTVSRATLLFGMTWIVNAIVISAVLVMILLSNLVAWRWPRIPQAVIIAGLALTLAGLALVPLDWFNTLTGATKLLAASAFLTAPVFFAGLIFIRSFAVCEDKSRALGSNLIGALVGGLLEALSFITGVRALILLVALFYLIAICRRPAVRATA